MKKLPIFIAIIVIGFIIYFISTSNKEVSTVDQTGATGTLLDNKDTATTTAEKSNKPEEVIGKSVQDRDIMAYHFGTGETEILAVGGIHGGYSWNTVTLAYELIDYLKENPGVVPENIRVTVIPALNPDGLNKVVGSDGRFSQSDVTTVQSNLVAGRFNGNNVDLNRNFDCDWNASGVWQNKKVSGGSSAFSEPESLAIKNYAEKNKPAAVLAWYSAAGGVYASSCHNDVSEETSALTSKYASASGYKAYDDFDFYEITGDMMNWFAKNNIPAISVVLTNHSDTEWSKNKAGIEAILKYYSK